MKDSTIDFDTLWRKIHGELTTTEEVEFREWINAAPAHKLQFEKIEAYYKAGTGMEYRAPDLGSGSLSEMKSRLFPEQKRKAFPWYYSAAACLIFIVSIVLVWKNIQPTPPMEATITSQKPFTSNKAVLITSSGEEIALESGQNINIQDQDTDISSSGNLLKYNSKGLTEQKITYNTLIVPRGGEFSLVLSDGSKVWLNSESSLKYPVAFYGKSRQVILTGEAYFDVTKDPSKPFIVNTQNQKISVLGTAFNVTSYPSEGQIITTLVEGKVNVNDLAGNNETLVPGQQTVLNKRTGSLVKKEVDVNDFISWKKGIYIFENQSLEKILNTLSRWYDMEVHFEDPQLKTKQFTGEIKRYENINQFLEMIETTGTVKFEINEKTVTVK